VYCILKRENKTAVIVTHDIAEGISMADRLIVLSKRPGRIQLDMKLEFAGTGLGRREEPIFREYFNRVWKELDVNVQ